MNELLILFVALKLSILAMRTALDFANRRYYQDKTRQTDAMAKLAIGQENMAKTLAYSEDKFRLHLANSWTLEILSLAFLCVGGFGWVEKTALSITGGADSPIATGVVFLLLLSLLSYLCSLPGSYISAFHIEEKHGFNRTTMRTFVTDNLKSLAISAILGGAILGGLLAVMKIMGNNWWLWAWGLITAFSLLTQLIYPTLIAPLFNKFSPIQDGELKDQIYALARKIDFSTSGIFIMDASTRSSHGNAYFTGLFKEKRIVLFDTLLKDLSSNEIVAVLAHELGHFKLNHVRWQLFRAIGLTGCMFFLLSLCLNMEVFYHAFYLSGVSNYGALLVFSLWLGLIDFFLSPISSWLSRTNEFAADSFAANLGFGENLRNALLKLRETNHSMPITHPAYSAIYYSHPPILERLAALEK